MTEPRRVLVNPGMVGARLQRIVERDLQPRAARFREEQLEVVEGPQLGVHRRVASFRCADRPGAARVVRPAFERIVAALAMRSPDRMDRGEVDDVEAHGGDRGQALRGGAERAAPGRPGALRARKHLVPGGEARPLAVHPNGERAGDGRPAPVCGAPHQRDHLGALRLVQTSAWCGTGAELARKDNERALVGRRDTFPVPALGHDRALLQVQAGVLAGLDPDAEVAQPGAVVVGHAAHGESPITHLRGRDPASVPVVALRVERDLTPAAWQRRGLAQLGKRRPVPHPPEERVVTVRYQDSGDR